MFKNIIIATDGSGHAMRAAEVAADIAGKYGARLIIVNVSVASFALSEILRMPQAERFSQKVRDEIKRIYDPHDQVIVYQDTIPLPIPVPYTILEALSNEIISDVENIAKAKGIREITRISVLGKPEEQINELSKNQHGDLIVLGTRGLSDIAGLVMGSVSHKVIHMANCPCLLVK